MSIFPPPSKYKENKQSTKEINTLDNKHRNMVKQFNKKKQEMNQIKDSINKLKDDIDKIESATTFTPQRANSMAALLDKKENLEIELLKLDSNYDEMDYYDNAGDLITNYYSINENDMPAKDSYNILDLLSNKQQNITIEVVDVINLYI